MPTSNMSIRTLYVKRFRSSDSFVFSTLPQRSIALMNPAKILLLLNRVKKKVKLCKMIKTETNGLMREYRYLINEHVGKPVYI